MRTIIKKYISTEKAEILRSSGKHTFEVDIKANKIEIRKALEKLFNIKVKEIRTSVLKPTTKVKYGRKYKTSYVKKAVVKLEPGNEINFNI